jgi:hypothetical protein
MDVSLTYRVNTHLAAVYYNNGTPHLFRINADVKFAALKQQLDQLNNRLNSRNDTRTVTSIEYRKPSIGSDGCITFTKMKLENDVDIQTMFSIYSQYSTKGPIELEATLTRSVEAILASLNRRRTYDEIAELMIEPEDQDYVVNLADP